MGSEKPSEFRLLFEFEKATKNTLKYAEKPEAGQPPRIGSLYVQKWVLGTGEPPPQLSVTVAVASRAADPMKETR